MHEAAIGVGRELRFLLLLFQLLLVDHGFLLRQQQLFLSVLKFDLELADDAVFSLTIGSAVEEKSSVES